MPTLWPSDASGAFRQSSEVHLRQLSAEAKAVVAEMAGKVNKYHNRSVVIDGLSFDSRAEAARWCELRLMERAGEISDLQVHPVYTLAEGFRNRSGQWRGPITYEADFAYVEGGQQVVEDVKGVRTAAFQIKRKLFERRYPEIEFRIVCR